MDIRPPRQRTLIRRDAEGAQRTAPSWETLTERLIREAQADGAFDDLPGHGRPLQLEDDHHSGELALVHHVLRNASVAPPWIEVDKEVRALRERIGALLARAERAPPSARPRLQRELDTLAAAHDEAVRCLESLAPGPRQHRRRLDRAQLARRLAMAMARPGAEVGHD